MPVRQKVGMFDMSSFGKIKLVGRDAEAILQRIAGNDVAMPVGKIVYTQFLNKAGHIEADVTITRLADDEFLFFFCNYNSYNNAWSSWFKNHPVFKP